MDFAVWHEGIVEGQGKWVLAIDTVGERFLLGNDEDKSLYWRKIEDCKFVRIETPDVPVKVIALQPQQPISLSSRLNGHRH